MSYRRPDSLAEALSIRAGGARVAAGCTDLFPATRAQNLDLDGCDILDVTAVPELLGVTRSRAGLRIGAATSWSALIQAELPPALDGLKAAAREVGAMQIQNAGTIGGNICNASPAADGAPPLLTLDAAVELACVHGGRRRLPLGDFILGPRQTALASDELLTAILVPTRALGGRGAFIKLGARKHLVISIVMAAARIGVRDGHIDAAAVAVGACSAVAARLPAVEAALLGGEPAAVDELVRDADVQAMLDPISDMRADAGYRREAATILTRRAVMAAAA